MKKWKRLLNKAMSEVALPNQSPVSGPMLPIDPTVIALGSYDHLPDILIRSIQQYEFLHPTEEFFKANWEWFNNTWELKITYKKRFLNVETSNRGR